MIEYQRSARSFIQYHLTPVRSVHHPEDQGPISLARLSRVGTSCQFRYDFMVLKGAAIKYLGTLWTKADTEPHAEIIGSDLYQPMPHAPVVPVPSKRPYICVRCVDFASIHSVQDIWKIDKNCVRFVHKYIFMYALQLVFCNRAFRFYPPIKLTSTI